MYNEGKIISGDKISKDLNINASTVYSSINKLINQGAPIKRIARGVYMVSHREKVARVLEAEGKPMTPKEIGEKLPELEPKQIRMALFGIEQNPDSGVVKVEKGVYAFEPEIPPKEEGFDFIPVKESKPIEKGTELLFEKIESLPNNEFIIRGTDGKLYKAQEIKVQEEVRRYYVDSKGNKRYIS